MLPLLIESTESYAGKSLVCLGLGLKFQKDGFLTVHRQACRQINRDKAFSLTFH